MRTIQEIEQQFPGAAENGLTAAAAAESAARHGLNRATPLPREPLWRKFLEKFDEPIIRILLAAALLSMLVELFRLQAVVAGLALAALVAGVTIAWLRGWGKWLPAVLLGYAGVLF